MQTGDLRTPKRPGLDGLINSASKIIAGGGVVVLPADTCYGIMGAATCREAWERAYAIKGRERHKPLGIVTTTGKLRQVAEPNATAESVVNALWPQPVSLIVRAAGSIPEWFTAPDRSLLVLTARNHILRGVAEACCEPIFTTTCNRSGEPEARAVAQLADVEREVDLVIADDTFAFDTQTTTTLDTLSFPPRIIRPGAVRDQDIAKLLPDVIIDERGRIR